MTGAVKRAWLAAVLALTGFYAFLITNTSPKIEFDAEIFWAYAQTLMRDGLWHGLQSTAPPREPGYPLFLFFIEKMVGVQTAPRAAVALQFVLLLAVAAMAAWLISELVSSSIWPLAAFLAVGLSPALLNAAMCLYAESVTAFFFTAWVSFFAYAVLTPLPERQWASGLLSAILGGCLVLTRPAYLHVTLFTMIVWAILSWRRTTSKRAWAVGVGLYAVFLLIGPFLWMARNERVAGFFNLADHAGIVLRGRYEKSLESYTLRDVAAGTLNAASESACRAVFKNCDRYKWSQANVYGYLAAQKLQGTSHLSIYQANQLLFKDTIQSIVFEHPFRFFAFSWFEMVQLIFFETVSTGATQFRHPLLRAAEGNVFLRGVVHFGLSVFYAAGFTLLLGKMFKHDAAKRLNILLLAVSLAPVLGHFLVYSMATTVLRYSFVVAPLYETLALVGWSLW